MLFICPQYVWVFENSFFLIKFLVVCAPIKTSQKPRKFITQFLWGDQDSNSQLSATRRNLNNNLSSSKEKINFLILEFLDSNPCGSAASKYRQMVLDVVRPCLESSSSRLISLGVSCLQRVVRDDRFHSRQVDKGRTTIENVEKSQKTTVENVEKEGTSTENVDEESWMTVQVLAAVHPINTLTDEHQQEILKVSTIF